MLESGVDSRYGSRDPILSSARVLAWQQLSNHQALGT
jgi:hypothetical protein